MRTKITIQLCQVILEQITEESRPNPYIWQKCKHSPSYVHTYNPDQILELETEGKLETSQAWRTGQEDEWNSLRQGTWQDSKACKRPHKLLPLNCSPGNSPGVKIQGEGVMAGNCLHTWNFHHLPYLLQICSVLNNKGQEQFSVHPAQPSPD